MNESVTETIAALIQPTIELDSALSLKEQDLLAQLDEVRSERRRLAAILRAADPERVPTKPGPKSNQTQLGRTAPYAIAEHIVEEVRTIVAGFEGEFNGADVLKVWETTGSEVAIRDKINKSFARLRERGQIRLVSNVRGRHGGYRYVATERINNPNIATAHANGSGS